MPERGRGHYGFVLDSPNYAVNVAQVVRSASSFGAHYVGVIGREYEPAEHPAEIGHSRHLPVFRYRRVRDFVISKPPEASVIAVDADPNATPIHRFAHPDQAIYVMGNESTGFDHSTLLDYADCRVTIPMNTDLPSPCLNVAHAATVVMYDRQQQQVVPPDDDETAGDETPVLNDVEIGVLTDGT